MNLIVAVDSNWAIGSKNELLIRIPNDHKHFREETTGKVVVLGRKTLETFPQGMPLKNRTNIILSKDPNYQVKDAIVVHSIEELLEELKKYDKENIYIALIPFFATSKRPKDPCLQYRLARHIVMDYTYNLISIHIFLLLNGNYAANIHLLFLISNHSCLKVQAR